MDEPAGLERYRLLATAIAGRPLAVAEAEAGSPTWTDGVTVFMERGLVPEARLRRLAAQASLVGAGSLSPDALAPLKRRPALARRYLAVEGPRAVAFLEDRLPPAARGLVDQGAATRSHSVADSLAIATGRERIDDPPDDFGALQPRQVRTDMESSLAGDAATAHVPRSEPEALRELDDDEDDERPNLDVLSSPVGGGGGIGKLLKKVFGDARSGHGGPPGADAPTHRSRSGRRGAGAVESSAALAATLEELAGGSRRGAVYPEWDQARRSYRPDWCTVREEAAPAPSARPFAVPDPQLLRRSLTRVGMALESRRRQPQGIDIDLDAAVEARVDALAGTTPDDNVYVDVVRRRRDLSVLVLLDASGSSGEPSPAGGTVHDQQRKAAAQLVTALHDLGDRVALYAFRSQGRTAVQVVPLKRFDDPLGRPVWQRLDAVTAGAYTRLGAAIRHGGAVLEREAGTSRRLLVVLSDGFAYDHGYEGPYGEADARRALAEVRRGGTGCLCLSLAAPRDPDALRRVFGTAAHGSMPSVDLLPDRLAPLFRFALRSADAQRRKAQRTMRTKERLDLERRTA
jgi:hypothetical protein